MGVKNWEGEDRGLFKNIHMEKRKKTIKTRSGQSVPRLKFDGVVRTELY
jgi:hypothetical protein